MSGSLCQAPLDGDSDEMLWIRLLEANRHSHKGYCAITAHSIRFPART